MDRRLPDGLHPLTRNPLRSEAEAFRFLLVVIGGAVVIFAAAYVNTWLGVAAAVLVVAGIVWWLMQDALPGVVEPPLEVDSSTAPGGHRVLVVAMPGTSSVAIDADATEIVVTVPALASGLEAANAEQTALSLTRRLSRPGVSVRGQVGADDPWLAAEDALRTFDADTIVVAGDAGVAEQIRSRVTVPVTEA